MKNKQAIEALLSLEQINKSKLESEPESEQLKDFTKDIEQIRKKSGELFLEIANNLQKVIEEHYNIYLKKRVDIVKNFYKESN